MIAGMDLRDQSLQNILIQWTVQGTDILVQADRELLIEEFEVQEYVPIDSDVLNKPMVGERSVIIDQI